MSVIRESFGFMPDGREVFKYTITNLSDYSVSILTLGATLCSFVAEDSNGEMRDVLLGFDTVAEYLEKSDYQGATVGPYCNRIGGASLDIDGKHYDLIANEKDVTCLHSGGEFSFALWNAIVPDADCVEMSYTSPDGQGGFPGEMEVKVIFSLGDDNKLSIKYFASADRKTYINLTNHAYFNLNGFSEGSILEHSVKIHANKYVPVNELSIPIGELREVKDTPFDFSEFHCIGERIDADFEQLKLTGGYDHNYSIEGYNGALNKCAEVLCNNSGTFMNVYTTLPGVQFYTGNFLDGKTGKNGAPMNKRTGFCLETQFFPDTPHNPEYPNCLFEAGEQYTSETVYEFGIIK